MAAECDDDKWSTLTETSDEWKVRVIWNNKYTAVSIYAFVRARVCVVYGPEHIDR